MVATPQTQAFQAKAAIEGAAAQLLALYQTIKQIDASWTDDALDPILKALNTAPVAPDGSIGPKDATPNNAHPIDPASYPSIQRAASYDQITQGKSTLDSIVALIEGGSVAANPGARAILNALVGG